MAEYIYDEQPFGTFSYDRDANYDATLIGKFAKSIKKTDQVLDVGCGEGFVLGYLNRKGVPKKNLLGVDLGKKAVAYVKKLGFSAKQDDNTNLSVKKQYDVVISNGVIHHTGQYEKSFSELVRVTKPKGKMFLSVYYTWHPYTLLYFLTKPIRWMYRAGGVPRKIVLTLFFQLFRWCYFVPIFLVLFHHVIDRKTAMTLFSDQFLTPIADVRSKKQIFRMAQEKGCSVLDHRIERGKQMLSVILKKN